MTANGWLQIVIFLALILAVTKPMGVFMARVFNREKTFMDPVLRPIERLIYRTTGVDEAHEMKWRCGVGSRNTGAYRRVQTRIMLLDAFCSRVRSSSRVKNGFPFLIGAGRSSGERDTTREKRSGGGYGTTCKCGYKLERCRSLMPRYQNRPN